MSEPKHVVGLPDAILSLVADPSEKPGWVSLIQHAYLAGRQLRRILAHATARFQLCDSEFLVLWTCQQATPAGVPQGELTGLLCLSPAQLSSLVYDLRDRGLVQVERPVEDRRRQLLRTTDAGRELITQVDIELESLAQPIEQRFSLDERRTTSSLLERLIRATAVVREPAPKLAESLDATATIHHVESPVRKAA